MNSEAVIGEIGICVKNPKNPIHIKHETFSSIYGFVVKTDAVI